MFGKKKNKKSFFEKLTGSIHVDEYNDEYEDDFEDEDRTFAAEEEEEDANARHLEIEHEDGKSSPVDLEEEMPTEVELSVDVIKNPDNIIINAMVAGVKPEDLDISITRDMVTIKGKREESREYGDDDYFSKELFWGSFSRTIMLPDEIEVEEAKAAEKHGLLTIVLPRIDKDKKTKLRVKSE